MTDDYKVNISPELCLNIYTGKNNGCFPFLDFLGYLKNTHKNPKFGKVRQVPIREFPTKFPDCLTLPNLGFLWVFFKYPKISKNGNLLFFPVLGSKLYFGVNCSNHNVSRHFFW